ncbi:MAG: S41 family peptidase, partial [Thermoanaerobaculia bacterium]|nr:S41 family peptidase [Thermoanaerobaculia bacterium]
MTLRSSWPFSFIAGLLLFGAVPGLAQGAPPVPPAVSAADRAAILDDLLQALEETYVFPETAEKMTEFVRRQEKSGAYDALSNLEDFTEKVTEDLRSVSHDLHLRVRWSPPEPPEVAGQEPSPEEEARRFAAFVRRDNACFRKVELLTGNVGYVKLDCFMPASFGGATAVAAMGFLAGADALIFDLRDNGGGSPSMIQLLTSYLVTGDPARGEETIHLNSFYIRNGDRTDQYWTQAWVPGTRMTEVPVFVLTSGETFSAAEEFTYNLKSLKRGTIVGETTGGGAHPVNRHTVEGYPVVMSLPFGRAINPITHTNWEGTGVTPDVAVPAADALREAHGRALGAIADKATDPEIQHGARFARRIVEGRGRVVALSAAEQNAFVG